ncbi:hypothetical protein VNI00_005775 [Paramarasmius palmivorus]|uniref:RRM domain-containing protein n=1 Tax=Paramarasmius palmivorus TaxID=297713 RepID=A0AAW0DDH0_9AGAR
MPAWDGQGICSGTRVVCAWEYRCYCAIIAQFSLGKRITFPISIFKPNLPILASSITISSRHQDEDFINKSLLEQLNVQADAEPISSSSDSEAPTSTSYGSTSNESPITSPAVPYHIPGRSQQHSLHRSGSPTDNGPHSMSYQIQSHDMPFAQRHTPKSIYNMNGFHNTGHTPTDYQERLVDGQKVKLNGLNHPIQRSSFTSIPNATRTSRAPAAASSALPSNNSVLYRDNANQAPSFYSNDLYPPPHLTSPTQSQMQPFDPRASFDYAGVAPASATNGGNHHKASYNVVDPFISNSHPLGPGKPSQGINPSHLNGFVGGNPRQGNFTHLSSQTPYGPHIPSNIATAPGGATSTTAGSGLSGTNGVTHEEISTIFVVGFPDDMQEREFQNMFTFSTGFEAATLKIPNKEYTSYNGLQGVGQSGLRSGSISGNYGYQGSNDPYNLVTVNQGGVVVDGGRDGTMTSWPAAPLDDGVPGGGHFFGGSGGAPRKQIIGFAKFRTREEALMARDMLQGRRVDIEKGSVLKAEMAKKNLHTKRGVGPVGTSGGGASLGPAGSVPNTNQGLGFAAGVGANLASLQQQPFGNPDLYSDLLNPREREMALMGIPPNLGNPAGGRAPQWQPEFSGHPNGVLREREEDDRRKGDILGAMGLVAHPKGSLSDDEREKEQEARRGPKEALRLRSGSAFEAFHSVPPQANPLLPPGIHHAIEMRASRNQLANGFNPAVDQRQQPLEVPDLWDPSGQPPEFQQDLRSSTPSPTSTVPFEDGTVHKSPNDQAPFASSESEFPGSNVDPSPRPYSDSCSSSHSHRSASSSDRVDSDANNELSKAVGELAVDTENGTTSPQLPSPASGASSGSTRNRMDQNPPINTLYVGNLPTSPPPMGCPPDILEGSLRELFQSRPGFRRLSFKQKSSGPMCFVEFEDVSAASKTMNELSGHTLKGLVKGQGIRLSYSRNPLGVRTPTSGGSSGPVLQQQQAQSAGVYAPINSYAGQAQSPVAQNLHSYMISPPPPRFSTSPAAPFGGASPFPGVHNQFFVGNNNVNFSGYRLTSSSEASFSPFDIGTAGHSSIPDQSTSDSRHFEPPLHIDHHIPRALSPPSIRTT